METHTAETRPRIVDDVHRHWDAKAAYGDERMGDGSDYRLVDATDEAQLLALGGDQFDAILCSMALMDVPVIEPLVAAGRRLLTANGRLVISNQHPAFNSNATWLSADSDRDQGALSGSNVPDIPPVLAARFVPRGGA